MGTIDRWTTKDQALEALARDLTQARQFSDAKELIHTIEDLKAQLWSLGMLAIALMRQQRFAEAFKALATQTPDDFVHILASCASILDQLEAGLSLASSITSSAFSAGFAQSGEKLTAPLCHNGRFLTFALIA